LIPFFACRGPVLTPADTALILGMLGSWLASVFLFFVNLYFVFTLGKRSLVLIHGVIVFSCLGLVFVLLESFGQQSFCPDSLLQSLPFGIPAMVIGHFVYLVGLRRKLREASKAEPEASQVNSVNH